MGFACLMYHSLSDGRHPDSYHPKYTTTRAAFTGHLRALHDAGFQLAGARTAIEQIEAGKGLPANLCLLTFDDGHKSSIEQAELMTHAGVSGTFFLTMNYCRERPDFLKPEDIRELSAAGFDFGTHGATHQALSRMSPEQMRSELADSKAWLEDILGRPVLSMSLPAGQGGPAVAKAAWELGYRLVGNSVEDMNNLRQVPAEVNRFVVLAGHGPAQVCGMARGSRAYIWQRRIRQALLTLPKRLLRSYDATRS